MKTTNKNQNIFANDDKFLMKVAKAENIVYESTEDDLMILCDEDTQETHFLNATAGMIFRLCDGRSLHDIFSDFKEQFRDEVEVSEDELRTDLFQVVEQLLSKNALRIVE